MCVLKISDKIAAVAAGSGMTGRITGFIGVINAIPQWVLNTVGCAVKTRYPNVPHPNVKSTDEEHEFRLTLRFVIYSRGAIGHYQNAPNTLSSSGDMLMLMSFRAMARVYLISNDC